MLKQGTKLVRKTDGEEHHIGGICGEIYFIVHTETGFATSYLTEKGIKKFYTIVEEKWEPQDEEKYWFFDSTGSVACDTWLVSSADLFRRDYLGIYQTEEEAQNARDNMKKIS